MVISFVKGKWPDNKLKVLKKPKNRPLDEKVVEIIYKVKIHNVGERKMVMIDWAQPCRPFKGKLNTPKLYCFIVKVHLL